MKERDDYINLFISQEREKWKKLSFFLESEME